MAIPVYGYDTYPTDRVVLGALPLRVIVVRDADLVENGGNYRLAASPLAMPVFTASVAEQSGAEPIAVYPVNGWQAEAAPVSNWWEAGGATGCVGAYLAKGAASLTASYSNLVSPSTNDLTVGVAPNFDAASGWEFTGTQYLITAFTSTTTISAIVQYSDVGGGATTQYLFGVRQTGPTRQFSVQGNSSFANAQYLRNIATNSLSGKPASGNKALSDRGYYNGVDDVASSLTGVAGTNPIFIGALGNNGVAANLLIGKIQAIAFYDNLITAPQVAALATAMAAL